MTTFVVQKQRAMGDTNYSLNISNILDFLEVTGLEDSGLDLLHCRLGIEDDRAHDIGDHAYDVVWDGLEGGDEFSVIKVIANILREAKIKGYSDTELFYYLYFAIGEIEGQTNPLVPMDFDDGHPYVSEN